MSWKKMNDLKSFKCALLGTVFFLGASGAAQAITIEEAIQMAISTNPDIGAAAANREAVDQELRQARGLYLPQVDVEAAWGPNWVNDSTTRANAATGDTNSTDREEFLITVQQRIFDGFEAGATVEREQARVQSAANVVRENAEVLALDTVGAYLEVLRGRELVRLADKNLRVHLNILSLLEERLAGGGGSRADVTQTEVRVALARATLTENFNLLRNAEADYARTVGQFPDSLEPVEVPIDAVPADIDQLVEAARRDNLTTKIADANVDTAEAEIELAEVPLWPTVTLEALGQYNDGTTALDTYEYNGQVVLRFRWNLFRGGIDRAARQEALMRLNESKNRRLSSQLNAEEEARRFWFALEASRESVADLEKAVQFSRETRDAYVDQFEVAQRTLLDVLDAENELFVSASELTTARTNESLSAFSLMAVTGNLISTLGLNAPEQASVQHKSWQDGLLDD